jgi:hypothetical protein
MRKGDGKIMSLGLMDLARFFPFHHAIRLKAKALSCLSCICCLVVRVYADVRRSGVVARSATARSLSEEEGDIMLKSFTRTGETGSIGPNDDGIDIGGWIWRSRSRGPSVTNSVTGIPSAFAAAHCSSVQGSYSHAG